MDEVFKSVRNMFANHAVAELHCKTIKLIDKFGYEGTELYLQAQLQFIRNKREADKDGDDR